MAGIFLLAMTFFVQTLSPRTVKKHPSLRELREELIELPTMTNFLLAGLEGLTLFFAINAVTLSSPKLWGRRLKDL